MFAYLSAFGNAGWDKIDVLVKEVFPSKSKYSKDDCFQWMIGECLDPVDGQALRIVGGPVCPNCHGKHAEYGDDVRTGAVNLPDVAFSKFLALDDATQKKMIQELCDQWLEKASKP